MPDTLNKQSIINLLIDSPLREPIKINLIDIVNNTSEPDLPKVYSTITKELEIFQKATERRMKLAEETIAKLSGEGNATPATTPPTMPPAPTPEPTPQPATTVAPPSEPAQPTPEPEVVAPPTQNDQQPLAATPLDLPPIDQMPKLDGVSPMPEQPQTPSATPTTPPPMPSPQPLGAPPVGTSSDEDALAEIQKELDSLKSEAASDIASATQPPTPADSTAPINPNQSTSAVPTPSV